MAKIDDLIKKIKKSEGSDSKDELVNEFLDLLKFDVNNYEAKKIEKKEDYDNTFEIDNKKISLIKKEIEKLEKKEIIKIDKFKQKKKYSVDYLNDLNKKQLIAATRINGTYLVIAGAGSGKTRTLVYRVSFLLENDYDADSILLLTFTRKSANEMKTRISELLSDKINANITATTFHSFSNMILRRYSKMLNINSDYTIIDQVDSVDLIDLIVKELFKKKDRLFPKSRLIATIISKSSSLTKSIKEIIDEYFDYLKEFSDKIELISETYKEYKKLRNYFDYDDLIDFFNYSYETNQEFKDFISNKYKFVMVDEFQDTSINQRKMVNYLTSSYGNLMIVGDDAQSIYSFRGADVENILKSGTYFPKCKIIKLEENYRSQNQIIGFINQISDKLTLTYKKKLFTKNTSILGEKPIFKKCSSPADEAKYICDNVITVNKTGIPLSQICILYRSSYHNKYIETELIKRRIPYQVFGGIKFIERRHIRDMLAYLKVSQNPYDTVSWHRILKLLPDIGGITATKIVKNVYEKKGAFDFKEFSNKKYYESLKNLGDLLEELRFEDLPIEEKLKNLKNYYFPILQIKEIDYKKRIPDIDVFIEISSNYKKIKNLLSDFALDPPSSKFVEEIIPDDEDKEYLVLSTIHSSKGLEWNTVFLCHLLDGLFPSNRTFLKFEELEEERRLFYVACSRAKEHLFLTSPGHISFFSGYYNRISRFLKELEF